MISRIVIVFAFLAAVFNGTLRSDSASQSSQVMSERTADLKRMLNEAPREEWFKEWYDKKGLGVWKNHPEMQTQEWSINPADWKEGKWIELNGPKRHNDTDNKFMGSWIFILHLCRPYKRCLRSSLIT